MIVDINEVRDKVNYIVKSLGHDLSDRQVKIIADSYIDGEIQGKKTHGLAPFAMSIEENLKKQTKPTEILKETQSMIYADANNQFGVVVGTEIATNLIEKASSQGVAIGLIRNMQSWLRPVSIAEKVARKGLICMVVNNGGEAMISPPGGVEPVVGTNPIGIGVPLFNEEPWLVDMATSVRAWGEVRVAKANNSKLTENAFLDKNGSVTINPEEAYSALSFGGYKGFALALFIEIMCCSLLDMPIGQHGSGGYDFKNRGSMIIVIDPESTVGREVFSKINSEFLEEIRKTKSSEGGTVTLPGDRTKKNKEYVLQKGSIDINNEVWEEINRIYKRSKQL